MIAVNPNPSPKLSRLPPTRPVKAETIRHRFMFEFMRKVTFLTTAFSLLNTCHFRLSSSSAMVRFLGWFVDRIRG
ncbi:hypothetical protein Hanom_Chr03g00198211 [Helianthus anomalus]